MENIQVTHTEWENWKAMCRELRRLGIEINEQNELTRLIREWGDSLVTLRASQEVSR